MGPTWPFLLMYGSHDMRHTGFRKLTVVNGTPGFWGVTILMMNNGLTLIWSLMGRQRVFFSLSKRLRS